MSTHSPCPDSSQLEALLRGDLPAAEQASLESHLKICENCRARLDELTGQVGLLSESGRREVSEGQGPDTALHGAMSRLKAAGPHSEVDSADMPTAAEQPPVEGISLDFLDPPTQSQCLGQLGTYEISGVVGHGGMGVVLKGRDPALNRYVAIKVLSPQLASSVTAGNRFMREAQMAAAVSHDHVVTIHAVAKAKGLPFLVMEYVAGVSLEERIRRTGPLKVEEILRIGMQAASGLAAAHAQGLVHRDIKPSNILLENGVERVKITDFGLARVVHEAKVTQTGVVAGTPEYMSPEQARGEEIDRRSDLFSLGCVLYAMCTGRSPFRAATVTGAIHRVCEDTPRPIRETNPDIPDWLTGIIDRLLAKKPEDRFQTAGEVADILGGYLAHVQQPSQVALPSRQHLPQKSRAAWRGLSTALTACAAVAVVSVIGLWLVPHVLRTQTTREPASPRGAELPAKPSEPPSRFFHVDLGPRSNRFLTEASMNNLAELQPGILEIEGVPMQIGSCYIQLCGERVRGYPEHVDEIHVNRKAATVHFLHGCADTFPEHGAVVAVYTFHYEDGSKELFPVVSGRHVRDWYGVTYSAEMATQAKVGWRGSNPVAAKANRAIQLFHCCWVNPHPDKTILTIDFERSDRPFPAPFCVGITCDNERTSLPGEPGLLSVSIGSWATAGRYSVVVPGDFTKFMTGKGNHNALLPAGSHPVEIREGDTLLRRGTITLIPGGRSDIGVDIPMSLYPVPTPQPNPQAELLGQTLGIWDVALAPDRTLLATAGGDGTVVVWRNEDGIWGKHVTLESTSFQIRSIAFSPDGRTLATAAAGGALRLWDVDAAKLIATLAKDLNTRSKDEAYSVAFSPDGEIVASGHGDGRVDFWNATTHAKIGTISAHVGYVCDIAFSPDGTLLATGGMKEATVKIWDVRSMQQKHVMHGHSDSVLAVCFSADGQTLASASQDRTVKLWAVKTGELLNSFSTPHGLCAVAISPNGRHLAAAGDFQTVHVWDLKTGNLAHEFQAHWGPIRQLAFTGDGKTLISASMDNSTRLWSVDDMPGPFNPDDAEPRPRASLAMPADWSVWAVFLPQEGDKLAAMDNGANCRVWDLQTFTRLANFSVYKNETGRPYGWTSGPSMLFMSQGESFVTCASRHDNPPEIGLWQAEGCKLRSVIEPSSKPTKRNAWFASLAMDDARQRIVVVSPQQNLVSVYDLSANHTLWSIPSLHGLPSLATVSPDGKIIAVGTELGSVILLDAETGRELRKPLSHGTQRVTALAFSPQGSILVSTGQDSVVRIWTLPSFSPSVLPQAHLEKACWAGFSPDGSLLVTAGGAYVMDKTPWKHQGEVCLWDVTTKRLLSKFRSHCGCVTSAVFSPDGKTLATTGRDGKVNLWDVEELLKHGLESKSPAEEKPSSGEGTQ